MATVLISGIEFPQKWILVAAQSGNCWGNSLINSATLKGANSNSKPLTHTPLQGQLCYFYLKEFNSLNTWIIIFKISCCSFCHPAIMETCHRMPAETHCAAFKGQAPVRPPKKFHLEFLCATGLLAVHWLLQRAFTWHGPYCCNPIILLHRGLRTGVESGVGCALIKIWKGGNNVDEQRREI